MLHNNGNTIMLFPFSKDDLCVYDAFMNHTCKGIECKRAICTGLGACTYENLDYVVSASDVKIA